MPSVSRILLPLIFGTLLLSSPAAAVHVHGYVRHDGTVVSSYERRSPHHDHAATKVRHTEALPLAGSSSVPAAEPPHPKSHVTEKILKQLLTYWLKSAFKPAHTNVSDRSQSTVPRPSLPAIDDSSSDLLTGTWQLRVAKSNCSPNLLPKSQTLNYQGAGQDRKETMVGINPDGSPIAIVFEELIEDGRPHPVTGTPLYDARASTRVDAHTIAFSNLSAGKTIQTGTDIVSQDGKTLTSTIMSTDGADPNTGCILVYQTQ